MIYSSVDQKKVVDMIIEKIKTRFTLGTTTNGLGLLLYFRLNMIQLEDYSVSIDANDKFSGIAAY